MSRHHTMALSAMVATLVCIVPARAEILDQSFEAFSSPPNGHIVSQTQWLAQSFTVGLEGILTRVDIEVARSTVPPLADLFLDIRQVLSGGAIAPSALASTTIPAASVPTSFSFHPVDLSFANLAVSPGDQLAIVLRTTVPGGGGINPYAWELGSGGGYPGGSSYVAFPQLGLDFSPLQTVDYGFRTYVSAIPEPSSVVLLGAGFAALVLARRRCQRADAANVPTAHLAKLPTFATFDRGSGL